MSRRQRPMTLTRMLPSLLRILRRFRPYLRPQAPLLVGALLALLLSTAARLLEPWPLKLVIDRVVVATPSGGVSGIAVVDALEATTLLTLAAIVLVGVIAVRGIASYLSTVGFALAGHRVLSEVRNDLYRHLQGLSLSFHDRAKTGELTLRIIGDIVIEALPNGYDTLVGERGVTLSSGQRQRIAIARAAMRPSPILILDEPTTGLDRHNAQAVIQALEKLAQGRTVIMVTHDLELAARADRIFYLEVGRIREEGCHAELLAHEGAYTALFRGRSGASSQARARPIGADYAFGS